jgi:hypothetical protein
VEEASIDKDASEDGDAVAADEDKCEADAAANRIRSRAGLTSVPCMMLTLLDCFLSFSLSLWGFRLWPSFTPRALAALGQVERREATTPTGFVLVRRVEGRPRIVR